MRLGCARACVPAPCASSACWSGGALTGCARDSSAPLSGGTQTQSSAPAEADRLTALRADTLPTGFELADKPRNFVFPLDHGPHPTFRHEWWYLTGHLDAAGGEPFGFELTFFRFALKPPTAASASANPSAWRTSQIYMAHFAVSDIGRREFKVAERFAQRRTGVGGRASRSFSSLTRRLVTRRYG